MTSTEQAAAKRAPPRSTQVAPGNVAFKWEIGDAAATDAAFKSGAGRREEAHRQPAAGRQRDGAAGLRGALRGLHRRADALGDLAEPARAPAAHGAFVLGIPEHKVRVIAPDVGGGFGSKIFLYNEEIGLLLGHRARSSGRSAGPPTRREAFHDRRPRARSRDRRRDGAVQGRQDPRPAREDHREPGRVSLDLRAGGADLSSTARCSTASTTIGRHPRARSPASSPTPRRWTPTAAPGRPEACYVLERMVDAGGGRAQDGPGRHPARRTSSRSSPTAYQTKVALSYDSGDYRGAFDKLLQMLDYKKFRAEQAAARDAGPADRRRLLDLHRGVPHRARPRSWARSAPRPGSASPARCGCIRPAR